MSGMTGLHHTPSTMTTRGRLNRMLLLYRHFGRDRRMLRAHHLVEVPMLQE